MKIPEALLEKWQKLRSHGDGKNIVDQSGGKIYPNDISRAFKEGECSDEVFEAIAGYYQTKEGKVKSFMDDGAQI